MSPPTLPLSAPYPARRVVHMILVVHGHSGELCSVSPELSLIGPTAGCIPIPEAPGIVGQGLICTCRFYPHLGAHRTATFFLDLRVLLPARIHDRYAADQQ